MVKEYNFAKTAGRCAACQTAMAPEQEFVATIREQGEEIVRDDYCLGCWQAQPRDNQPGVLAVWHARVPKPEEKKRLFIDDELLVNFFQRLEDSPEPAKLNFRFVLALILMRSACWCTTAWKKRPTVAKRGKCISRAATPNTASSTRKWTRTKSPSSVRTSAKY